MIVSSTIFSNGSTGPARVCSDGTIAEVSHAEAMRILETACPTPTTPVVVLERHALGLLFTLFQRTRTYPVVLDRETIGTTIGFRHNSTYSHYTNGHTLEVDEAARTCLYTCLTYVDGITPQEQVWVEGCEIVSIAIHDFMSEPERINPDHRRFHGALEHVVEMLHESVKLLVFGQADGDAKVNVEVERGATPGRGSSTGAGAGLQR